MIGRTVVDRLGMLTIAIQRASPTRISPCRSSGSSGRNAQANANWKNSTSVDSYERHSQESTYHEERGYDPIDEYAEGNLYPNLPCPENIMQALISNLA